MSLRVDLDEEGRWPRWIGWGAAAVGGGAIWSGVVYGFLFVKGLL